MSELFNAFQLIRASSDSRVGRFVGRFIVRVSMNEVFDDGSVSESDAVFGGQRTARVQEVSIVLIPPLTEPRLHGSAVGRLILRRPPLLARRSSASRPRPPGV